MELRAFAGVFLACCSLLAMPAVSADSKSCGMLSNTTCDDCLSNVTCLWCETTQQCMDYPVRTILPPHSLCPLANARWGTCWVNFQILIITISVVAGVILIAFFICLFCCCKCENIGAARRQRKMDRQAEKRKNQQDERKAEMKARHDEIRTKYGLTKANPYSRFENS